MSPRMIVISGSMGSGKTTVLGEASDLLSAAAVAHAAIDLDALGTGAVADAVAREFVYRSLGAIYQNIRRAGIRHVLLAEAVETREELERIRGATAGAQMTVCRLVAPAGVLQARVRARERGMLQQQFVDRARHLDDVLRAAALEDFALPNYARPVTEVARELLQRAGWCDRHP